MTAGGDEGRCGAHSRRTGQPCRQWPVAGATRCRMHGGTTTRSLQAADRRIAERDRAKRIAELLADHDLGDDVDPHAGLLEVVRRTGAMMRVLGLLVGELDPDTIDLHDGLYVDKPVPMDSDGREVVLHPLMGEYRSWTQDHAKACKLAIDAGIDERKVRLAEGQVTMLERAVADTLREVDMPAAVRQTFVQTLAAKLRALPAEAP